MIIQRDLVSNGSRLKIEKGFGVVLCPKMGAGHSTVTIFKSYNKINAMGSNFIHTNLKSRLHVLTII